MPVCHVCGASRRRICRGITLLVTLVIVGILGALAVPAYQDSVARGHVKAAAESIYGLVSQARAETRIRDQDLSVIVDQDRWCVGISDNPDCDCTQAAGADACYLEVAGHQVLHRVDISEFPEVSVRETFPGDKTTFYRTRQNASPWGSIYITANDQELAIKVNMVRARLCAPEDSPVIGYREC